ncbi:UDP-N-acetylglucosamine--N-acetylmuramyl-(pentapeptide) pyrophosphoryl-undecaprenol N-acetylglucosamine transferase [Paenibacillus sp. V4I3]|uniref:undecaprenyldiphospho-muramoylpentapeptide beta-N-acetylglucosaminyltransferase n=1 Tax=unclassified Paenibacillus TaxID=185978 RepID=UPI00277D698F|nr:MULTISPECIES: undecaprenyldiphospho-muramoylpentapeptide beta-N-acetylglucosaminyltransferase [unclassified Paenibacillus]MDQ0876855.1 UDP-N-acetylglucosamine--N-acetylmuramyl-(pentapeptide) pyrophosphoryl-undecaprenol N-acetylglucosamine transferase [Paenibacillus sp. V4I3]MDQ0887266.1 UDP-N-acetylglucosamine--N-acetylmuramyl-(pentapeptide) pyrophosphoryl-undecaprenol N-acetylglucosamine transferase [Paenibacillus sp. V4I9]
MKTIVFTGGGSAGHVTPNIALMHKLAQLGWEIKYIGSATGIEKDIIEREGVPFYSISSGKLRRYFDLKNFKDPFKVMKGVYESYRLLRRLKPAIVFSKGGFVSVPVVLGSRMNKIPVIIHESDITPGLANKISIPFATKVCVTFPESLQHVQRDKAELTGLPIREHILSGKASRAYQLCDFHTQKPVILVMGGSLGSQVINQAVRGNLRRLLAQFQIVHLCGKGNIASELANTRGYKQFEYLNEELPDILAMTELVISRAGATSIYEFLVMEKPMLLIPLSLQASRGDQILNAESFQKAGYADVLQEDALTADTLAERVEALHANREAHKAAMQSRKESDAVASIVKLIETYSLST